MYDEMKEKLRIHLIQTGFTFSNEREPMGEPTLTRSIPLDVLVDNVVDYLVGAGYANDTKTTI